MARHLLWFARICLRRHKVGSVNAEKKNIRQNFGGLQEKEYLCNIFFTYFITMVKSILVIDDNETILVSLKYVLSEIAEKVLTLNTPEKALALLAQEEVSVVLLDMNFSLGLNTGSEGLKWLQTLKSHHPQLPIVLFTAYADVDIAVRGLKMGASDFVIKPWDNEKLIHTLLAAVEKQNRIPTLGEVEDEHIRKAIDKCHGNLSLAAEMLGISRQTLYNKMKRGNI